MPRKRPSRVKTAIDRFARAERGATAVEFALISVPFLVLIFAVIELGLVLLVSATLESATEAAGRQIRTGQFQQGGSVKSNFQTLVCNGMSWLSSSCSANLFIDVRTFNDFTGLAGNKSQPGATFDPNSTCWTPGEPTDIVLVRTYYKWKLFTPLLDASLQNMGGGSGMHLLSTATAFRNEPYNDNPPVGAKC